MLPVIQRCKRVVVVGDPKQLRHVSFLSHKDMQLAADRAGIDPADAEQLNYRSVSLLDLARETIANPKAISFLDEYFRGLPQLIAFSNREYYHDGLKVMTRTPSRDRKQAFIFHHTQGDQDSNNVNKTEVKKVIARLRQLIRQQGPQKEALTIGIMSPFRNQIDAIRKQALQAFSEQDMQKHRMLFATPYGLQGSERDIVIISLSVTNAGHDGSFRY